MVPLDDDEAAELFDITQALTTAAGLPAYETSNHARMGEQSRHNLAYWRYQDYAGIGPGAEVPVEPAGHYLANPRSTVVLLAR